MGEETDQRQHYYVDGPSENSRGAIRFTTDINIVNLYEHHNRGVSITPQEFADKYQPGAQQ